MRWDDTRPKSSEIQQAPLMPTQFVWQWLSGDGALVDVICQHYAHLTQQLRPWGSRESVVMLLQLKNLKWQVWFLFVLYFLKRDFFFLISKSHKTTHRVSGRVVVSLLISDHRRFFFFFLGLSLLLYFKWFTSKIIMVEVHSDSKMICFCVCFKGLFHPLF